MTSKHSTHLTPLPFGIRPWLWRYTYLLLLISMLWHRQAFANQNETSCLPLLKAGFEPRGSQTPIRQQTECLLTNRLSYPGSSLKTWTRQPVPMISKHSVHLTPLPFGIRTWLWRYTYLLLLISMLWHRQAIFESKGDKISSCAESRIRTQRVSETYSPADWMPADKLTELSRIKLKNLNSTARVYDQQAFSPPDPTAILAFPPGSGDIHICCCEFRCSGTGKRFSNRKETSCLPLLKEWFEPRESHLFASRLNACWQTDWTIEDQA